MTTTIIIKNIFNKRNFWKISFSSFIIIFLLFGISCTSQKEFNNIYDNVHLHNEIINPKIYPYEIYANSIVKRNIKYGEAEGYYTSKVLYELEKLKDRNGKKTSYILKEALNIIKETTKKTDILSLYMDIYRPQNLKKNNKTPIVLFVHGGGFFLGDKNNQLQEELTRDLIENGVSVASINYRLGSKLWGFNNIKKAIYCCVQDVRSALRYITYYADELNIDPDRIYLAGSSSGGIIALTTAFMDEDEIFECCNKKSFKNRIGGLDDSGNSLTNKFKIAGTISLWGSITDLNIIDERNDIPTLLFHGTEDNILYNNKGFPFCEYLNYDMMKKFFNSEVLYGSYAIYKHMKEFDMNVKYISFKGYNHAPHVNKDGTFNNNIDIVKQEIRNFLFTNKLDKNSVIISKKSN